MQHRASRGKVHNGDVVASKPSARLPRVSQKLIAQRLGVAQSTVSVVLAGRADEHSISDETARLITTTAEELGYRPNIAAQRMRGINGRMIGVHTYGDALPISHLNHNHAYLLGVQLVAESVGYDLVLFTSAMQDRKKPSAFADNGNRLAAADGAIILGFRGDHEELARLSAEGYPYVRIGRRDVPGTEVPWVDTDHEQAGRMMIETLHRAGFPGLCYLGRAQGDERARALQSGARGAAQQEGIPLDEILTDDKPFSADELTPLLPAGPITIVAESHALASQSIGVAHGLGLRIGSQVRIAVLDSPFHDPAEGIYCAYLDDHRVEIGRLAAEQLVRVLDEGRPAAQTLVPTGVSIARPVAL